MSFSINASHNFLVDTPIVVEESPNNTQNNSTTAQSANNETKESNNDSNILIMGGRIIGKGLAYKIVDTWLNTAFEGGRHQRRLDKINEIDANLKSKSPGHAR